ncbi:MAG: helix-turn-helix domain-containing protein [Actinomycetes bacterium]
MGSAIRRQREFAQLSLRELARTSKVSNAYLSQVERGLHEPSLRVLSAIADALSVPVEELLLASSTRSDPPPTAAVDGLPPAEVERAVRADTRLSRGQQDALLAVYHSYLAVGHAEDEAGSVP